MSIQNQRTTYSEIIFFFQIYFLFSCVVFYVLCGGFGCDYTIVSMAVVVVVAMIVVYCSIYIILLYYLYYFNVLNAKIKSLMLDVLSTSNSGTK